jgi:outer membrane lipoprotein-sorting protein
MNSCGTSSAVRRGIAAFLLFCAAASVCAGDAASPVLAAMSRKYNPAVPFSTKFTLTISWAVREKQEKKQGSIALAPGEKFRVTAGKETYVSNGSALWTANASTNQVVIKPLAALETKFLPSQIFSKYIVACPFREQERKNGIALFVWKSDSANVPYPAVRLWVREKSGEICRCEMVDRNDNRFDYTFTGTVFNATFSKQEFEFAVPKNARIVDLRT